jgi:hypothetical protein
MRNNPLPVRHVRLNSNQATDSFHFYSGTTFVYILDAAFQMYFKFILSASKDSQSGFMRFPKSVITSLRVPTLNFAVSGVNFGFNNYASIIESSLYSAFGLDSNYYHSWLVNVSIQHILSFHAFTDRDISFSSNREQMELSTLC